MEGFSVDKSTWMAPQSRIFCIATAALLSHEKISKMTVSCQWRIVRLVVTDQQVLFYKHEEEQKIENFQDLEQLSITSCSLSKDSLSPLEVNALRLTHESLIKTIEGLKILFHEPPIKGAPLLLQTAVSDPYQQEQQDDIPTIFLSLQRDDDAFYVQRSLKLAQAWLKYKQACQSCQIWPSELILDWIQESIYNEKYPFPVQLEKFGDQKLDLQAEALSLFLMESQAIRSLKFSRDYQLESKLMEDKHLLINIKYDQIFYLQLVNCNMDRYIIGRVVDIVSANSMIRTINFSHNYLTDDCLGEISRIVENCHQLNIMDLSYNQFKGDPQHFGHFFDIINLLQDELIEGIDEPGFKLVLSNNQINDDIVSAIEQFILFPVSPKILNLDLSFNQISKYNLWRLYKGYLKDSQRRQNLILNIFPLPFHPDILQDSINIFRRMKSEQPADQQVPIMPFHYYQSSQMRGQDQSELENQPNGGQASQVSRNASIEIRIERLRNSKGKPLPNKKAYVDSIKIYKEKIAQIMRDPSKPIESYLKLSKEIDALPYEFPLCVLENFQEFIWQKLMEALLIRDHYSIGILKEIGGLTGLDLEFFNDYLALTATRRDCLMEKINKFLNFEELEEKDVNDELCFLVKECLRLDLRGPTVSQLFMIKEKRDEYINRQIDTGFIPEIDTAGIQRARGNCFLTLTGNEERKVVPKSVFSIPVNGNLFAHPARADYVVLAKLSQKLLLQLDETLDSVIQQYESNYFVDLAYKRVQFLLEDFENLSPSSSYAFFERIFTDGLRDLKLACARIVLQHVNYQHRLLSRAIAIESRKQPLTQRLQEIIMPLDAHSYSQQYTLTNFMYLRKFEFYFSQSEISLNSLTPADMFMDKLEETFVKPLVQFPVPECQPDCEKAMFKLVECIVLAKDADAATTMPPVIAVLLHIMINSEFNPHIRDEVYLQILKYLSKPLEDEHQFNILGMLSILFIYAPPSEELNHFMRAYMFRYVGRMRYDRLAQESLISLQISSTPQAAIPDWIPSTYEMKQRLQGYQNFILVINFPDRTSQEYSITPFITAGQLMDQVYKDCKYFQKNALTDIYHFWVYTKSISSSDEVALLYEEILMEIFSEKQGKNQTELIVKRRIYPPFFTMRLGEVHSVQLTCLLNEQLRLFYGYENEYIQSIPVAYVIRVAAYYLCIQLKIAVKKKIDKLDQKTVEQSLDTIIPVALKFNKSEVSQIIATMINKERILEKDIQNLSFNILSQLRYHPFYCSSRFDAIINESTRDQVSIIVNAMLINIFKKQNLFIPSQSFFYEEIVSAIAIDQFTALVQFFNKDSKQLIQLKFKFSSKRAHEFVQDIVSYAYFRIKDSNMALYAYSELAKLRYRHCLLSAPVDVGTQEPTSPFVLDINANLNEIERKETKDQLNQLSNEIVKTQYVQPDIGDYPYFRESTQFNLNFADRQMRRTSYSESQLQNWFNGVLMQRQKEQEELLRKQAEEDEAAKQRNERLTLSGKGSNVGQASGSQGGLGPQNVQTQQINSGNSKLVESQNLGLEAGIDDKTKQQSSLQAIPEIENSAGLSGRALVQSVSQKGNVANGKGELMNQQGGGTSITNINNNLDTPETDRGLGLNKGQIQSGRSSIASVNSNGQNSKKNSLVIQPNSQQDQQLPLLILPDKGSARSGQVPSTPVSDRSNSNQILKDKLTEKLKDAINLLPLPGGTPRQVMGLKQQESSPLLSVEGVTSPLKIKKSPSVVVQPQGEGTQPMIQLQKSSTTAVVEDPKLPKNDPQQQTSSIAPKEAELISSRKPSNAQVPSVDQIKPVEGSSSDDLPHLRHSRNSSRDNQKEKSPSDSREKIKAVSRLPSNLLAFKNTKKSTGGSSRDSLETSQQTSTVANNNNEQIAPQGQPAAEEPEQVQQAPVLAARKPPTFFKKK